MTDKEIIKKWKQGLSKNQLATMYKRQYNKDNKKYSKTQTRWKIHKQL